MSETVTAAQESWIKSERIRKAAPDMFEALDMFPSPAVFPTAEAFLIATDLWWDTIALPAIEKARGERP